MKRIINVVLIVLSLSVIVYLAQSKMGASSNSERREFISKEKFDVTLPGTTPAPTLKTTVDTNKTTVMPTVEINTKKTVSPVGASAKSGGPALTAPTKK